MKLNIVIPMAGLGSRFRDAGYSVPKPLIEVLGRPMYAWAAESLPLAQSSQLIFILLSLSRNFQSWNAIFTRGIAHITRLCFPFRSSRLANR